MYLPGSHPSAKAETVPTIIVLYTSVHIFPPLESKTTQEITAVAHDSDSGLYR